MANNLDILDGAGVTKTVKSTDNASVHTPHHNVDALASGAIVSGAVASGAIASGAVASGAFASGALASGSIASGALASGSIASGAIAAGAIAAGATSIAENEDVASADGDRGIKVLFKRRDTPGNASGTDGDYEQPQMTAGRVWVDASGVTLTVASHAVTNAGTFAVQPGVATSGGESSHSALSTAAVYTAEVKGSAGQIYGVEIFNKGSAAVYARLYNQTGAPASTDGANIIWRGIVPGSTTGAGFVKGWPNGKICSTGIGIRVSGAIADNDTTVLAANEVTINVGYK